MLIEILLSWSNSRGFHTNRSLFQIAVILAALTVSIYWNLCYVTYIGASTLWNKTRTSDTSLAFAQCFVTIHVIDTSSFDRKGKAKLLDPVFSIQYWLIVNQVQIVSRQAFVYLLLQSLFLWTCLDDCRLLLGRSRRHRMLISVPAKCSGNSRNRTTNGQIRWPCNYRERYIKIDSEQTCYVVVLRHANSRLWLKSIKNLRSAKGIVSSVVFPISEDLK